jgi:hypothetical protein
MSLPYYDVVIATPGSSAKMEYVKSLVETTTWLNKQGLSYKFLSKFSSFVPSAREKTATDSDEYNWDATEIADGDFTYGKIIWIDSDIVWTVETFQRMLNHKLDVVGAMVPVNDSGIITAMRLDENSAPRTLSWRDVMLDEDPVEVDGIGFGMLAVRYGVFESVPRPWFAIRKANLNGVRFPVNYGEDYSASLNIKNAGFKIWLDPLAKVQHVKEYLLSI